MKDWPILFQGAMVRAILAGTKTQTRRHLYVQEKSTPGRRERATYDRRYAPPSALPAFGYHWTLSQWAKAKAGDILWVRETWAPEQYDAEAPGIAAIEASTRKPAFAADFVGQPTYKWRPSIHMPRNVCRLELSIRDEGTRVERLQDISVANALAEGIVQLHDSAGWGLPDGSFFHCDPRQSYLMLWDAINGDTEDNPWVLRIPFARRPAA